MAEINWRKIINFFSYCALVMCAIAIAIAKFIKNGEVTSVLTDVALAIALIVTAISAFFYARSKRNIVFMIAWVCALVLVIVAYIVPLI